MATFDLHTGKNIEILKSLPEESIHCCITSPPYWGLRDYGMTDQIGLEKTPDEYVERLVGVFREVRRVLRDDGTLWVNIGDSYAQAKGLKPKDLVGIPWMLAFALRKDGWYLRSEIIWHKPNPMPESVKDRPTRAHEQIFLLTKSPQYLYDMDAIREPYIYKEHHEKYHTKRSGRNENNKNANNHAGDNGGLRGLGNSPNSLGKNKRSVWTITPKPFKGAHFAVFPPELPETDRKS